MTVKRKKYIGIKSIFFFCMLFFILLMVVLVDLTVLVEYRRDITEKVISSDEGIITELATNIETNVSRLEENIYYKLSDSGAILHSDDVPGKTFSIRRQLQAFSAIMRSSDLTIYAVFWQNTLGQEDYYSTPGSVSASKEEFQASLAYQYLSQNSAYFQNNRGTTFWRSFRDGNNHIYLIKSVLDPESCAYKGILCMEIDESFFSKLEQPLNCSIAVLDEKEDIIYCSPALRGQQLAESENGEIAVDGYFTVQEGISKKDWTLLGFEDEKKVLASMNLLLRKLLTYEALFAVLAAILAALLSNGITYNIHEISLMFQKIEEGKEAGHIQSRSSDETAYLCDKFNDMMDRLQASIRQQIYENTQREKAEYNALIAQMNPHFLYNTLESISSLAKIRGQGEIIIAIERLSQLLRISLSGEKQSVPLSEELTYEENYLQIQKMMRGSSLCWEIIADPAIKENLVPKLILQPIIENAILHGVDQMTQDAMIVIVCKEEAGQLVLEVSDNGCGMDNDFLIHLQNADEPQAVQEDRTHIGLCGIKRRIKQLYGTEYGLSIESELNSGTIVRVRIPLVRKEQ